MTNAPVAEPLRRWVTSPASIDTALRDSLYLRIVDVEAALRARCYPVDIDVDMLPVIMDAPHHNVG